MRQESTSIALYGHNSVLAHVYVYGNMFNYIYGHVHGLWWYKAAGWATSVCSPFFSFHLSQSFGVLGGWRMAGPRKRNLDQNIRFGSAALNVKLISLSRYDENRIVIVSTFIIFTLTVYRHGIRPLNLKDITRFLYFLLHFILLDFR